jgi:hypothetical protein
MVLVFLRHGSVAALLPGVAAEMTAWRFGAFRDPAAGEKSATTCNLYS